jgi:hypothetical protein
MSEDQFAGMLNKVSYLRDVDILRDLEPTEVEYLSKRTPMQRVTAGAVFYSPEQAAEVLFMLKEDQVRLYHLSPMARRSPLARPPKGRLSRPGGPPKCASPTRPWPRWRAPTTRRPPRSWASSAPRG